ncbi:MAG: CDP-alcohol phosphatidyltransferase family protein [Eubacteriales bacterium]|nr:CDP-alcohol phosphatidyltransferase family protein [Eubacteriales bacterium]
MIGFYNYTVILTYMSLVSAMTGMTFAISGHFRLAIFCLALSGFFDMFDGKVARRKKDRTDNEKLFGIQLDSLCDVVAFGAFPGVFCYSIGLKGTLGMFAIGFYCVCGVIRLAYFNVVETNNFFSDEEHEKVYHGLPITSIAVILPLFFLLNFILTPKLFSLLLTFLLFAVGTLFIADFEMKKPSNKFLMVLVIIVAIAIILAFICTRYHVPMLI